MFMAALGLIQLLLVSREKPLLEFFISKVLSPEKKTDFGESCKWALDTFPLFSRRSCRRWICSSFAAEGIYSMRSSNSAGNEYWAAVIAFPGFSESQQWLLKRWTWEIVSVWFVSKNIRHFFFLRRQGEVWQQHHQGTGGRPDTRIWLGKKNNHLSREGCKH